MFSRARWRLTLWFAGVVALILAAVGAGVLLSARQALFRGVDDDLRARAAPFFEPLPAGRQLREIRLGPAFTAGGYFYALVRDSGVVIRSSENADPAGLPSAEQVGAALAEGPTFVDTKSSEGDSLRVYVIPVHLPGERALALEVGRSTEPERQALRRLLLILLGAGGSGLLLALAGGYVLASRALRPIQTAMDRQRAFVADASHELRTPLSLIRANAEILERSPAQPVEANMESVRDIIQETDRLNSLVGQMLTLARWDSGEAVLESAPLDLAALARDAAREMRLLAEPKNIDIEAQGDGPLIVQGDETRLRQLFTIVLDNAIKYSDEGGHVRVRVSRSNGKAVATISDTGRGIPPEALPHIFDRFYRVDKARSREMGGAGLGLAIAKWIAEAHRGSIRIESAPDRGTTATIELPAAPEP